MLVFEALIASPVERPPPGGGGEVWQRQEQVDAALAELRRQSPRRQVDRSRAARLHNAEAIVDEPLIAVGG